MARASSPGPITSRVTFGRSATSGGKSHSWVTATTSVPAPMAKSISVADGTRLTMRTGCRVGSGRLLRHELEAVAERILRVEAPHARDRVVPRHRDAGV